MRFIGAACEATVTATASRTYVRKRSEQDDGTLAQDAGPLTRETIEGPPKTSLSGLTASGEALRPALVGVGGWTDAHMGAEA
jgi:hypothetical protein